MPVDALTPTWINAPDDVSGPAYDAETLRRDFAGLVAAGASVGVARSGVLDPRALAPSLSGSNVQVAAGPCVVGTGKGAYFSGAPTVLTVDALTPADSTNPRRDRLVFEVLDPDNGGSTARKARFRVITGQPSATALTGGGYPADPGAVDGVSAFFNIADIDVPKAGNGSPSITDRRPFTAAAGAPYLANLAERDSIPKFDGLVVRRRDLPGRPLDVCDGTNWFRDEAIPWNSLGAWTTPNGTISRRWNGLKWEVNFIGHLVLSANSPFSLSTTLSTIGTAVPAGWRPVPGAAFGTGSYSNNFVAYQGPIVARMDTNGVLTVAAASGTLNVVQNCQFYIHISWTY